MLNKIQKPNDVNKKSFSILKKLLIFLGILLFVTFGYVMFWRLNNTNVNSVQQNDTKNKEIQNEKLKQEFSDFVKLIPNNEKVYIGAFADFGGAEDQVSESKILEFQDIISRGIGWAYFSVNFKDGIRFPKQAVESIDKIYTKTGHKVYPFIRLMPRSTLDEGVVEKTFTLENIINGQFDAQFNEFAKDVKTYKKPVLIDFAVEPNGDWFSWSGKQNGGRVVDKYGELNYPDGPEQYRDAYRHIIDIFRQNDVKNVTWFFHVNAESFPNEDWNKPKYYYPGDDYIDWIGISLYGALTSEDDWLEFDSILARTADDVLAISKNKPIALLEFGVTDYYPNKSKAKWIENAINTILNKKYIDFKAVSYWHENWEEKDGVFASLRLDSSKAVFDTSQEVFQSTNFTDILAFTNNDISNKSYESARFPMWLEYLRYKIEKAKTWFWQLQGKINIYHDVDVYDIDPESVSKKIIDNLHAQNKFVICYVSVGTAEKYRADYKQFNKSVLGNALEDWPDEKWLDIRKFASFKDIMNNRFKFAKNHGCDAIEGDNVDVYNNNSGFNVSEEDAIKYIEFLADLAHSNNMLYGLKNSPELISKVMNSIDFVVAEECQEYNECAEYSKITKQAHKPVFAVEYNINKNKVQSVCSNYKKLGIIGGTACYDLDGCWHACK